MNQNSSNKRKYIPWIFIPCVLAFVIQILAAILVMECSVVFAISSFKGMTWNDLIDYIYDVMLSDTTNGIIFILYSVVGLIIFVGSYNSMFMKGKSYSMKGISKNVPVTIVGVALFCIGMQYVSIFLMNALAAAKPAWMEEYEALLESAGLDGNISVILGLYAVLLGPVVEEFIFRGLTQSAASKVMPYYLAIFVQAVLFGAFHMNPIQSCYAFVLGLGLGYIMYLYDNIVITIIIHIIYNIFGTIGSEILPTGGENIITFFFSVLFALIVSYAGLVLLKRSSARVKEEGTSADI